MGYVGEAIQNEVRHEVKLSTKTVLTYFILLAWSVTSGSSNVYALPVHKYVTKWQSVELHDFANITLPDKMQLSSKICQYVPIYYEIKDDLNTENAVFVFQLLNIKTKKLYGETAWWGDMTLDWASQRMPYIGQLKAKVCRKNWNLEDRNYLSIAAKQYDVYFAYGYYNSDGTKLNKSELKLKLRFKK